MIRKHRKLRYRRRCFILLLALLCIRLWMDNRTVVTRDYEIVSPRIPAGFDGYRIAVLSDLHGNSRLYSLLLQAVDAAEPDILVLTGDLTDAESQWASLEPFLRRLTEKAPCYYVSGNHEWADLEAEPLFRSIEAVGVTVLRNEWVIPEIGGDSIALVGLEDPNGYADMKTPQEVFDSLRSVTDTYTVTLCHRPDRFPKLAGIGYDLVLSGHNHGGLIRLPLVGGLFSPGGWFPEYDKGLFALGDSTLLVSPGLCGVKQFPRLFNRPELSVAVLRHSEAGR